MDSILFTINSNRRGFELLNLCNPNAFIVASLSTTTLPRKMAALPFPALRKLLEQCAIRNMGGAVSREEDND